MKFSNIKLADGSIAKYDGNVFDASVIGQPLYLVDGAGDYAQLPDGNYSTAENQYFTIGGGKIKTITGSNKQTSKQPQNQAMAKITNITNDGIQVDLNKMKAQREIVREDSKEQNRFEKMFGIPKGDTSPVDPARAKTGLSSAQLEKARADRARIEGKTVKQKHSGVSVLNDPRLELFVGLTEEEGREILANMDAAIAVADKPKSQDDIKMEKLRKFFSAEKPKPTISEEMRIALNNAGYNL